MGAVADFLLFSLLALFLCRVQGRQTRRQSKGQRTGVDKQEATQLGGGRAQVVKERESGLQEGATGNESENNNNNNGNNKINNGNAR
jgi:membrane protein implicated in regulation of membrane protease activity